MLQTRAPLGVGKRNLPPSNSSENLHDLETEAFPAQNQQNLQVEDLEADWVKIETRPAIFWGIGKELLINELFAFLASGDEFSSREQGAFEYSRYRGILPLPLPESCCLEFITLRHADVAKVTVEYAEEQMVRNELFSIHRSVDPTSEAQSWYQELLAGPQAYVAEPALLQLQDRYAQLLGSSQSMELSGENFQERAELIATSIHSLFESLGAIVKSVDIQFPCNFLKGKEFFLAAADPYFQRKVVDKSNMVLLTTTSDRGFISEDYETLEATGFIERLLLKVQLWELTFSQQHQNFLGFVEVARGDVPFDIAASADNATEIRRSLKEKMNTMALPTPVAQEMTNLVIAEDSSVETLISAVAEAAAIIRVDPSPLLRSSRELCNIPQLLTFLETTSSPSKPQDGSWNKLIRGGQKAAAALRRLGSGPDKRQRQLTNSAEKEAHDSIPELSFLAGAGNPRAMLSWAERRLRVQEAEIASLLNCTDILQLKAHECTGVARMNWPLLRETFFQNYEATYELLHPEHSGIALGMDLVSFYFAPLIEFVPTYLSQTVFDVFQLKQEELVSFGVQLIDASTRFAPDQSKINLQYFKFVEFCRGLASRVVESRISMLSSRLESEFPTCVMIGCQAALRTFVLEPSIEKTTLSDLHELAGNNTQILPYRAAEAIHQQLRGLLSEVTSTIRSIAYHILETCKTLLSLKGVMPTAIGDSRVGDVATPAQPVPLAEILSAFGARVAGTDIAAFMLNEIQLWPPTEAEPRPLPELLHASLKAFYVKRDGNNILRAFAHLAYANQDLHHLLRLLVVNEIWEHTERYAAHVERADSQHAFAYLNRLIDAGERGNFVLLEAFANYTNSAVIVFSPLHDRPLLVCAPQVELGPETKVYPLLLQENFFYPVLPVEIAGARTSTVTEVRQHLNQRRRNFRAYQTLGIPSLRDLCVDSVNRNLHLIRAREQDLPVDLIQRLVNSFIQDRLQISNSKRLEEIARIFFHEHLSSLSLADCHHLTTRVVTALAGCKALFSLNLDHCPQLDSQHLRLLVSELHSLRHLSLRGNRGLAPAALALLARASQWLSLDFSVPNSTDACEGCRIETEAVRAILQHSRHLQSLVLENMVLPLADPAFQAFPPLLVHLNLLGCRLITDLTLFHIAERCDRLQVLKLCSQTVTDRGVLSLSSRCPALQMLALQRSQLTDVALNAIASKLHLVSLDLTGSRGITDNGFAFEPQQQGGPFSELEELVLQECPQLTELTFRHLGVLAPRLASLAISKSPALGGDAGLHALASHTHELAVIRANYCEALSPAGLAPLLQVCSPRLLQLDLAKTGVTDEMIGLVAELCPHLTSLCLAYCRLTDAALVPIAALEQLERLDLQSIEALTDTGLQRLSRLAGLTSVNFAHLRNLTDRSLSALAPSWPRLRELDLSHCSTTVHCLAQAVATWPELRTLSCRGLPIAGQPLAGKLHANLASLNLSYCRNLDDEGLRQVYKLFPNLQTLSLDFCVRISANGIHKTVRKCRLLSMIRLLGVPSASAPFFLTFVRTFTATNPALVIVTKGKPAASSLDN